MMNSMGAMHAYLKTAGFGPEEEGKSKGHQPFITISREVGAGGHTLAQAILERMGHCTDPALQGWQYFDNDICKMVANDPGLNVPLDQLLDEQVRDAMEHYLRAHFSNIPPQDIIHRKVFRVVRQLAHVGKAVIVGRGGIFLTKAMPLGVHVKIIGSRQLRLHRYAEWKGMGDHEIERDFDNQEKMRMRFMKKYFHTDGSEVLPYDVIFNTDSLSFTEMAEFTVELIRERYHLHMKQRTVVA